MIKSEALFAFIQEVFSNMGFPKEVSVIAASKLVTADLRGIDSHGAARLSGYVRLTKANRINTKATPVVLRETPSTVTLDADGGLGLWIGDLAMQMAIKKAEIAGTGWVAVSNSSHFGIAAAHAQCALEKDMIGWAMTNASPLVAPAGSKKAYLGTNPICVAIPAGKHEPFVLDMATSAAANGKLEIAQRNNKDLPEGWVQNKEGENTKDAFGVKSGGTLLPLGSNEDLGYHKGYGLGALVDILTGVLSGANFGMWVPPFVAFLDPVKNQPGKGIGHFFGAMRIDAFEEADIFKKRMDQWIDGIHDLPAKEGVIKVLVPGEPETASEKIREKEGIPLNDKVLADLLELKKELNVKADIY